MSRSESPAAARARAVETLEGLAAAVDPAALLAAMCCHLLMLPPGEYAEGKHGDVILRLELLAYHLIPWFGDPERPAPGPDHVNVCDAALDELMRTRPSPDPGGAPMILRDLRMHAELVRGAAYPDKTAALITRVLGRREKWFASRCGIGPRRAVAVVEAIVRGHLATSTEIGREAAQHAEEEQRSMRGGRRVKMPRWARLAGATGNAWARGYSERLCELGPAHFPVGLTDLEMEQPPDIGEWKALIALIGLTSAVRVGIDSEVEMRTRPLLVLGGERVVLLDWANALETLWLAYETIARTDPAAYEDHQRRRGRALEEQVRDALLRLFPRTSVFHDMTYPDPVRGPGATAQLDLLVAWHPFIILVEAKAGQFRFEGRLGETALLKSDLERTIGSGASQLSRALAYINSTNRPEFREVKTGRTCILDMGQVCRSYSLLVTQQELELAARADAVRDLGLLPGTPVPITLAAANLDTITRFCAGPEVFVHYLERRGAVQQSPHEIAADEMNLFGAYLDDRLTLFDELATAVGENPVTFVWTALSQRFDSESMHRLAGAPAGESIRLKLPPGIEELLADLRFAGDVGSRRIAFELLDLTNTELLTVAAGLYRLRKDGQPSPGVLRRIVMQEGDLLVHLMGAVHGSPAEMKEVLVPRTILEQQRRGARIALGFGVDLSLPGQPVVTATWCGEPTPSDQRVDASAVEAAQILPAPGWHPPGRNEPCWCGSGRKHKRCCLGRLSSPKA
jgi:hypothetical protein